MLNKYIQPSQTFKDICKTSHLIGSFAKGLDRHELQKIASDDYFLFKAADIKPEKGFGFVHLITTGSGERYGANNNADYFNKEARRVEFEEPKGPKSMLLGGGLKEYHNTFLKYAKPYRNHVNGRKNGKPLGEVVLEAYNDKMDRGELIVKLPEELWSDELNKLASDKGNVFWSMGAGLPYDVCFTKGTSIETEHGLKNIEDIEQGDNVRTHTGAWKKVLTTMRNIYSGAMYSIISSGDISEESYVTGNHPYLVVPRDKLTVCQGSTATGKRKCVPKDGSLICAVCSKYIAVPEWIAAQDLRIGDCLVYPVAKADITDISEDEAYILGMYAGDGHLIKQRGGKNKDKDPIKDMGVSFTLDLKHPAIIDRVASTLYAITGKECRKYDDKGAVKLSMYDQRLATLCRKYCKEYSLYKTLTGVLPPKQALNFVAGMLDSDGHVDVDKQYGRITVTSRNLAHTLTRQAASAGFGISVNRQPYYNSDYSSSGNIFVVCLSRDLLEELKDLSVKAGYITAWSTRATATKTRLVGDYVYTPVVSIREIEAVDEVVYNMSVEGDESYIANGVAVHNCSVCGNKAKVLSDYCNHVKYNKLELTKEGSQIFMYNDQPHFHDISCVDKPADRIAFGLSKVASENYKSEDVFAIDREINKGLYIPHSLIDKLAGEEVGRRARLLEKLADMEKRIQLEHADSDVKLLSNSFSDELDEESMCKLCNYPLDDVISRCNKKGILLPPKSFIRIVLKKPKGNIEGLEDITSALPSIFQKLKEEGTEAVEDGSYTPKETGHWSGLDDIIGNLVDSHSMDEGPLNKRVLKIIVVNPISKEANCKKLTQPTAESVYLAKEYAKYELSYLSGRDKDAKLVTMYNMH